ncbi:hypothetical protein HY468_02930 [Candidatus Roizmanbacteria bacterium]|nr:hypothetical protein [Candidatus Roizmanbacteria bacterium]
MFFKPTRISDQNESLPIRVNPILSLEVIKQHYIPTEGMRNNFVFIPLVTDSRYESVYNHSDVHIYDDYYEADAILKEMYK